MQKAAAGLAISVIAVMAMASAPAVRAAEITGSVTKCHRLIAAKGFPNQTETMARMSAIRLWTQAAEKGYGAQYAMWHNAERQNLRCHQVQESHYVMCFAKGRPCLANSK